MENTEAENTAAETADTIAEFKFGPVPVELVPGVTYNFDALRIEDEDGINLFVDYNTAENNGDVIKLFPRFARAAQRNLAERYSEAEVTEAMKHIRFSTSVTSPWFKIIRILAGSI
jgi:hypothetical protein